MDGHWCRLLAGFLVYALSARVSGEVTLDGTLGPAGALPGPDYRIPAEVGHQVGANLFHSFGRFGIAGGESATFSGPATVNNVIGRVTGGEPSSIDGTIRSTIPSADLFLVNPAGVMFGPNARLEVDGSFYAATAHYLRLQDGGRFDAVAPGRSSLTAAPPAAFGFLDSPAAPVTLDRATLQVPEQQGIALVGGDVRVANGTLYAPAGRVDLVAVGSGGEVGFAGPEPDTEGFDRLGNIEVSHAGPERPIADGMVLGNIEVSGADGGSIHVRGGRFVLDGAMVSAETVGSGDGQGVDVQVHSDMVMRNGALISSGSVGSGAAGEIRVQAEMLSLTDDSRMISGAFGPGDAGSVKLQVESLELSGGGGVFTVTTGPGRGGDIRIDAADSVRMSGSNAAGTSFSGLSASAAGPTGAAGDIELNAPLVQIQDGALIQSSTWGDGDAGTIGLQVARLLLEGGGQLVSTSWSGAGRGGNIEVQAAQSVTVNGDSGEGAVPTGLFTTTREQASGDSGVIRIVAPQLELDGLAQLSTVTRGSGNAGRIVLQVSDSTTLKGESGVLANALGAVTGRAGEIQVDTALLEISGEGQIASETGGTGDGGTINLRVDRLSMHGDGTITTTTYGPAPGGLIDIEARESIMLEGESGSAGGIRANSFDTASGRAGGIFITAPTLAIHGEQQIQSAALGSGDAGTIELRLHRLELTGGGGVFTSTLGSGRGGNIRVEAEESVYMAGGNTTGTILSGLVASAEPGAVGAAGVIKVTAPRVTLADQALVQSSTWGDGDAGTIVFHADQLALTGGSQLVSATWQGAGQGGNIELDVSGRVTIAGDSADGANPSGLFTNTLAGATGSAGRIRINAAGLVIDGGDLQSLTLGEGDAGFIELKVDHLVLDGDAQVATATFGSGDGGRIAVTASGSAELRGSSGLLANSLDRATGAAGAIIVKTPSLLVSEKGRIASATEGPGAGGTIDLELDRLTMREGAVITTTTFGSGRGGRIVIDAGESVELYGGSDTFCAIAANTKDASGRAGDILIATPLLAIFGDGQIQSTTSGSGNAGTIELRLDRLVLDAGGLVASATLGPGRGGDILIDAGESVTITGQRPDGGASGLTASAHPGASGAAGSIEIDTPEMTLDAGALIQSGTSGDGDAGRILVRVDRMLLAGGSQMVTSTWEGAGRGGDIDIRATDFVRIAGAGADGTTRAAIVAASGEDASGSGGSIRIAAGRLVLGHDGGLTTTSLGTGNAGDIHVTADRALQLDGGQIVAQSARTTGGSVFIASPSTRLTREGSVSASVFGGETSDGGNVTVRGGNLAILQGGSITATAAVGLGGRILVDTDVFLYDAATLKQVLNASSGTAGNDGTVDVNAPELDISGSLVALPGNFLDASGGLSRSCDAGRVGRRSSLLVKGRPASSRVPGECVPLYAR